MNRIASEQSIDSGTRLSLPTHLINYKKPVASKALKLKTPDDNAMTRLEDGYQPHRFDVFCTREKEHFFHFGNNRFRLLVEMRVERYTAAKTRTEKSAIVKEIILAVRGSGGRFIRRDYSSEGAVTSAGIETSDEDTTAPYYDIGKKRTIDKVGHALRTAVKALKPKQRRKLSFGRNSITKEKETDFFDDKSENEPAHSLTKEAMSVAAGETRAYQQTCVQPTGIGLDDPRGPHNPDRSHPLVSQNGDLELLRRNAEFHLDRHWSSSSATLLKDLFSSEAGSSPGALDHCNFTGEVVEGKLERSSSFGSRTILSGPGVNEEHGDFTVDTASLDQAIDDELSWDDSSL